MVNEGLEGCEWLFGCDWWLKGWGGGLFTCIAYSGRPEGAWRADALAEGSVELAQAMVPQALARARGGG